MSLFSRLSKPYLTRKLDNRHFFNVDVKINGYLNRNSIKHACKIIDNFNAYVKITTVTQTAIQGVWFIN
jgi:dissimilatory sulfite reductase (desulfoviridin) alpha/beta subunit